MGYYKWLIHHHKYRCLCVLIFLTVNVYYGLMVPKINSKDMVNISGAARVHSASNVVRHTNITLNDDNMCPSAADYYSRNLTDSKNLDIFKVYDILQVKIPVFLDNYKNPCWRDEHSGMLKCLPFFYLVGFAKCGSTFTYNVIFNNTGTARPWTKEPHWLARRRFKGVCDIEYYYGVFQEAAEEMESSYIKQETGILYHHLITGDGSTSTVCQNDFWSILPGNQHRQEPKILNSDYVRHLNPKAKIIILIRNPTIRMYSAYSFFGHLPSAEHFHRGIVSQINLYTDCVAHSSIRACSHNYTLKVLDQTSNLNSHLTTGLYHVYISDWMNKFPREQLLIVRLEDMVKKPISVFATIFKFLTLPPVSGDVIKRMVQQRNKHRKSKRFSMWTKTKELLDNFYRFHNKKLATLLGYEELYT